MCSKKKYQKKQTFFADQQLVNEDEDEPMYVNTTSQTLQAISILDKVYTKSDILEEVLSLAEQQVVVSNNYEMRQSVFVNFRNILKTVANKKSIN